MSGTAGFRLAMPEGSVWRVWHHALAADIGEVEVIEHRRDSIELHVRATGQRAGLPYPANNGWLREALPDGTTRRILIAGPDGAVGATYSPA